MDEKLLGALLLHLQDLEVLALPDAGGVLTSRGDITSKELGARVGASPAQVEAVLKVLRNLTRPGSVIMGALADDVGLEDFLGATLGRMDHLGVEFHLQGRGQTSLVLPLEEFILLTSLH